MTNVAFRAQLAGPGERMLTVTSDPRSPAWCSAARPRARSGSSSTSSWGRRCRSAAGRGGGRRSSRRSARRLDDGGDRRGRQVIIETTIGNAPVRVLAQPIETPAGLYGVRHGRSHGGARHAPHAAPRPARRRARRPRRVRRGGLRVRRPRAGADPRVAGAAARVRRRREPRAPDAARDHPGRDRRAAPGRDDPATVDRAIDDLDAGAARMEHLVADLLLLARTDAEAVVAMADTDLANAAAEATESLEAGRGPRRPAGPRCRRPCAATRRASASWPRSSSDNAIRHAPAGSRVTVSAGPARG